MRLMLSTRTLFACRPRPGRALSRTRGAVLALSAALVAAVGACADSSTGPTPPLDALPRPLTSAEQATVSAGNGFTFSLLREVNTRWRGENLFISPFSASRALGVLLNGANGATDSAMRKTLGISGQTAEEANQAYRGLADLLLTLDRSVQIGIASSVWYRSDFPVLPSFLDASRTYFNAEVNAANFADPATVDRMNAWAAKMTNDRITRVLERLASEDRLVVLDALYFKGSWRTRFDRARTQPGDFTRDDGRVVTAPLMQQPNVALRMGSVDGTTIGELAYGNGAYVMTIVLPPEGVGVDSLVARLDTARWTRLLGALDSTEADVVLPRFRITFEDTLMDVLKRLGMGVAFTPDEADFTRIAAAPLGRKLFINLVKQNSFVEVNEEGTEATAVTTVKVGLVSLPPSLRVDRPFLFAIRDRFSGAILFIGKVADPTG